LGTLTNMQNSLFVPDLGRLVNRRPTYDLSKRVGTNAGYGIKGEDGTVRVLESELAHKDLLDPKANL
jgi:hypothetical protein